MVDREFAERVLGSGFLQAGELEAEDTWALGRYQVQGPLGRGATSEVLLAQDPLLGRQVAIKVLSPTVYGAARFEREMQVLAALKHEAIVEIYDGGVHGGRPFFVMEYVGGRSLDGANLSLRERVVVLERVARACGYAHGRGVVHRDLKPANILLGEDGAVVADFGLAKLADDDSGLTRPGTLVGTVAYMAPEQVKAGEGEIGPATDVYALGAMLYEFLCGRLAHEATDVRAFLRNLTSDDPPARPTSIRPDASAALETVAMRALAKRPGDRYPSAVALADALGDWLTAGKDSSSGRAPAPGAEAHSPAVAGALIGLALLALVSIGIVLLGRPRAQAPVETKPVEAKPVEAKPVEAKPVEAKPAEAVTLDPGAVEGLRRSLAFAEGADSVEGWLDAAQEMAGVIGRVQDFDKACLLTSKIARLVSIHTFADTCGPAATTRARVLFETLEAGLRPDAADVLPERYGAWCDVKVLQATLSGEDYSEAARLLRAAPPRATADPALSSTVLAILRIKRGEPQWLGEARSSLARAEARARSDDESELRLLQRILALFKDGR
jgi:predicted Ser/Thr protein kinase